MSTQTSQSRIFFPAAGFARGQVVILIARWVLVFAGVALTLLNPPALGILRFQIAGLLALAAANFFLCAQVLLKRRTLEVVTYGASLFDILLITGLIVMQGGYASNIYVFYFPALLAMSVAFPLAVLVALTGGTAMLYGVIGLLTLPNLGDDLPMLFIRLLMLVGVAFIGAQFSALEEGRAARRQPKPQPAAGPAPEPVAIAPAPASV